MYRVPSRRRHKDNTTQKPNLIPILDAVFIFIFFLLMSASFLQIFEINSDVPMVSSAPPPKRPPLAFTIKVFSSRVTFYRGVPSRAVTSFSKNAEGEYPYEEIRNYMLNLKKKYPKERTMILEPIVDVNYEVIVKLMDSVRLLKKTDDSIYYKDKDGLDVKVEMLFDNIVFGNIQS